MTSLRGNQPPPIFQDIGERVKSPSAQRVKRTHLSSDDKLVILWGFSQNWSMSRICNAVKASRPTVSKYRKEFQENPLQIFEELPLMVQLGPKNYQCRFCGERRQSWTKMARHVLWHVAPYEIAQDISLHGVRKSL